MLASKFLKIKKFRKSTYHGQNPKNFSGDVFGNKYIDNAHCQEEYRGKLTHYNDNSYQK